MVDVLKPEQRKLNMSRIRGKDTKPEMAVRRLVHSLGYRYRLHQKHLPGSPDLVFVSRRKVINVHGCYWHMHNCKYGQVKPATNSTFWANKRRRTKERDAQNSDMLSARGWVELLVWECEVRRSDLEERLKTFLDSD